MRLNTATPYIAAATVAPALTHGFHVASRPAATRTSTSLAARRSMLPMLRRSHLFSPDIDRLFDEMDEMMEGSLAARFSRPSSSLLGRGTLGDPKLLHPLRFEVVQDETEYKMAVNIPGVEANDIDLRVDKDGRVLRMKGDRTYKEGGMKVQSRFEKTILLSPDVDTTKLAATMLGDVLTVVAPKIKKKDVLNKAENKKIEIKVREPEAALQDDGAPKIEKKNVLDKAEDKKIEIKIEEPEAAFQDDGDPKIDKEDLLDKAKDKKIEIKVEEPKAALQGDGAPKIEKEDVLGKAKDKKIDIKVERPEAALQDDGEPSDNRKNKSEKRWPVRDFPY